MDASEKTVPVPSQRSEAAPALQDERSDDRFLASLSRDEREALLAQVRSLSELRTWRSIAALAGDWALILLSAAAAIASHSVGLGLLAIVVIGTRQHALSLLMHDGAHRRLAASGALNDWLSDWFCAFPLFYKTAGYKASHFPHHRFLNTPQDPDWALRRGTPAWTFPQPKAQLKKTLVLQGFGFSAFMIFRMLYRYGVRNRSAQPGAKPGRSQGLSRIAFYIVAAAVLTALHLWLWFAVFWILPALTVLPMCMRVRSWAEHFGLPWRDDLSDSRTVISNPLGRFFFAPHNGGYHLDHHLFPSVPFYNLPALHQALRKTASYQASAAVSDGYLLGSRSVLGALSGA